MAFNANLGTQTFKETTVIDYTHPPVVLSFPAATGQGELNPGTVLALNENAVAVPYEKISQNIGTGDGSNKTFSGSLQAPIEPETVLITDGTQTLQDDGYGNLYGNGTGKVNYDTGDIEVTFENAPANGTSITANAGRRLLGILTMRVDTNSEDTAPVLIHGCAVRKNVTVKGDPIDNETVSLLRAKQIYVK